MCHGDAGGDESCVTVCRQRGAEGEYLHFLEMMYCMVTKCVRACKAMVICVGLRMSGCCRSGRSNECGRFHLVAIGSINVYLERTE